MHLSPHRRSSCAGKHHGALRCRTKLLCTRSRSGSAAPCRPARSGRGQSMACVSTTGSWLGQARSSARPAGRRGKELSTAAYNCMTSRFCLKASPPPPPPLFTLVLFHHVFHLAFLLFHAGRFPQCRVSLSGRLSGRGERREPRPGAPQRHLVHYMCSYDRARAPCAQGVLWACPQRRGGSPASASHAWCAEHGLE